MSAGADSLTADPRGTADRIVGDCHYCEGIVVLRFMGQLGSREVWGQTHAGYGIAGHDARTSAEVWNDEDDAEGW